MPTISDIRAKYPQYNDMSDKQFADSLHSKFYNDMPVDEYYKKIGFSQEATKPQAPPVKEETFAQKAAPYVRTTAEYGGQILGGIAGGALGAGIAATGGVTAPLIPMGATSGALVGSGIGYGAGKQVSNLYDELVGLRKNRGLVKEFGGAAKDVATGVVMEAAGQGVGKVIDKIPGVAKALYSHALNPVTKMSPEDLAKITKEGLEGGYNISGNGLKKLGNDTKDVYGKIADALSKYRQTGNPIHMEDVVRRTNALQDFYSRLPEGRAMDFTKDIDAVVDKYMTKQKLSPSEANEMKQAIYTLHRKHYGEIQSAVVESEKQIARGLKEEVNLIVPEIAALNENAESKIKLNSAIDRVLRKQRTKGLITVSHGLSSTILGTAGYATAGGLGLGIGGAAGAIAASIMKSPEVKSAMARAIFDGGKILAKPMIKKTAGEVVAISGLESAKGIGEFLSPEDRSQK